jgi:endonuclease/exonuclease/phosphatase family metal-dependent hydrolase
MFKLVTWNIRAGRGPDGKTDLGRIIARLDRFCIFDIVCVQEVSSGAGPDGEDQFALLRRCLPGHAGFAALACDTLVSHGPGGARRRSGLMAFSRHPVLAALRHSLPWPAVADVASAPRCALELTVAAPGGLLRITTVQLERYARRQRLAQVERLRELHREASLHARSPPPAGDGPLAPRAMPALLAGEFNMLSGSAEQQRLLAPLGDGLHPWRDCRQLAQQGRRPPATLDYVFASADLAGQLANVRIQGSGDAAEHGALVVELDWRG